MITAYPEIFARLFEPWPDDEVRSLSKGGRSFGYLRADQVMSRLDEVLGPENWWDSYERDQAGSDSVLCKLTIRLPDGELLSKQDLGAPADMPDEGDAEKSAVSDALKRTAVKYGVGRWLRGPIPDFAADWLRENGRIVPGTDRPRGTVPPASDGGGPVAQPSTDRRPTNGKQFFAWLMKRDEDPALKGIAKYINQWANGRELPGRFVDWTPENVEEGWLEATRKMEERTAHQTRHRTNGAAHAHS